MMRIWYSVAMSLDGFIAGEQGEYDWIPPEPEIDWGGFSARFDTVLMGRRSYEAALATPGGGKMPGMRVWVFSETLRPEDHPAVTIVRGDLTAAMQTIRETARKDIWLFGGGNLFRSLLAQGHVDYLEIALVPVLLGKGLPMLPATGSTQALQLIASHLYPQSGIMMLTYEVER